MPRFLTHFRSCSATSQQKNSGNQRSVSVWLLAAFSVITASSVSAEETAKHVLFIAGRPSHGYGSHEHYAGCMLLADQVASANLGVTTEVVRGWPKDADKLEAADSIVIYCDGGGGHVANPHRDQMQALMDAGKGLVCLHYAVEVPKGEIGDQFITWLGGYFETHWSVNPHWIADFKTLPEHPIANGVESFAANDEWYFHMRFVEGMRGITPILAAVAPESTMRRPDGPHSGNPDVRRSVAKGEPQTVAWTYERPDGGRSFGYTGGHFHWNWGRTEMQRLVANAILWTAKAEVPAGGVGGEKLGISELQENQDYDKPQRFNPEQIADEFKLGSIPIRPGGFEAKPSVDPEATGKRVFKSDVVNTKVEGHTIDIDVTLNGASDLFLVAADGGNGFSCDWADWISPKVIGEKGTLALTELKWESASSNWGSVRKNANAGGGPLTVENRPISNGIGTHANSVIHFKLPEGYRDRFTAQAGLDTGGSQQNGGNDSSVQFLVYTGAAPKSVGSDGAGSSANRTPENALAGLEWPDDLEVTLVASEPAIRSLTNLDIDDKGRIWVLDVVNYRGNNGKRPEGDRILILEDTNEDGVADEMKVFYQGRDIDSAMGICVLDNEVIVSAAPYIWKFTDTDRDDRADEKVAMFTETGQPQHDHSNHSFLFGPDGKLYWNIGNTGKVVKDANGEVVVDLHGRPIIDNGKPFYGGMPFRCDLDGSNMEVLAHNFRNNWETTVDSFGTLWQSDNDDDGNRGVRINFVMEHGNYGYRDTIDGSGWREPRIGMEAEIPLRHWHLNDPGVVPNLLQTGAGSPTGITVYEGRLLPERFHDQVMHCDAGPNVVRSYPVEPDGAGYTAKMVDLLKGTSDQWFRPADVCVAPDGSIFVTDWYDPGVGGHRQGDVDRGRLFRIAPPGTPYKIPTFDYSTPEGAALALLNANAAVRFKAWMALHKFGSDAEPALLKLYLHDENPRIQARALWLLGKTPGRAEHYVKLGLRSENPDLRTVAIRLARQTELPITQVIKSVINDPSPRVRREALVAIRFDDSAEMPELWARLAAQYDGKDRWYLEALGIGGDLRADECFAAWLDLADSAIVHSAAGKDIAWRMRSSAAAEKIVEFVTTGGIDLASTDRYFRSLEFHDPKTRETAMLAIAEAMASSRGKQADETSDAIVVRALARLGNSQWRDHPEFAAIVTRHAKRLEGTPEFIELVKSLRLQDQTDALLRMTQKANLDSSAVEATQLLLSGAEGRRAIQSSLSNDAQSPGVLRLLGMVGNRGAMSIIQPYAIDQERPYETRAAAVKALTANNIGTDLLLQLAEAGDLPGDAKVLAAGLLSRARDNKVRQRASQVLPMPTRKDAAPLPPVDYLASLTGDVQRGEQLFRTTATCANCHVVGDFGKQVGPDLSEIGDKLPREAMLISILDPSAGISHNYENYVCLLDSGQVITGVKVSETEDSVTLRTAEAIDRKLDKNEIEQLKKSEKSIMPENLHHMVDQQGLIDIVEYMTRLKKASN